MTEGRVALVTGSSRGIGRALAEHLLGGGWHVVGCSRGGEPLVRDRYLHIPADVASESEVRQLLRRVGELHGRLDAAINNAGVSSMNHALLTPGSTVERIMRVNVDGTILVSREAARLMRKRRFGRIVNFASVALPLRLAGQAAYVAAKAAIVGFSQVLAHELGALGITVNVVGPAPIATDLLRGVPETKLADVLSRLALARLGSVADVANVVDFFLRPESGAVTGQVIYLGGA